MTSKKFALVTSIENSIDTSSSTNQSAETTEDNENSIDTSSSTNQSTETTEDNDSKNITSASDEGTGYAPESGSNFEESNYFDEANERRSNIRKLLKNLSSKSGAEPQMLQCYKDDLNLKRKMIENMEASEENFKERISKVNKIIEGTGAAIAQSIQLLSELVKVRQNPAPCQFPQEIFQNMNHSMHGLTSPP